MVQEGDVQGMVVRGFTHRHSAHVLFRGRDRTAAQEFLRGLLSAEFGIQTGLKWDQRPDRLRQISLTHRGLQILGCEAEFPTAFVGGPARDDITASWLGAVGRSRAELWWDGQGKIADDLDGCVHLYAESAPTLQDELGRLTGLLAATNVTEVFPWKGQRRIEAGWLPDDRIHFGYLDGISQPEVAWPWAGAGTVDPYLFILGLARPDPPLGWIAKPEDDGATNFGTYLVLQTIRQDVPAFNRYLKNHEPASQENREKLAAKLVGRWRNGSPLAVNPGRPDDASRELNQFDYAGDLDGRRCPFSAHIRVTNPRDASALVPTSQPLRSLIRRGVPYGPQIDPLDATEEDGIERGLVGLFLCSNIEKQFEILSKWMHDGSFRVSETTDDEGRAFQDGLMGTTESKNASARFQIPASDGGAARTLPIGDFVTNRGTLYLFLPSLGGLRHLAGI